MDNSSANVKALDAALGLGFSLSAALQNALGVTVSELARREGWNRTEISMLLNGHPQRRCEAVRDRLAHLLTATREDVDRWIARERAHRAGAVAA